VSSHPRDRDELTDALLGLFRQLSTATILFHQAVADRLGMNVTDHKCADVLGQTGPITAGELAERTGLTTGAITGVVDRLEKAGFVRRAADPADRRRVVVVPLPERAEKRIGPLFDSMARASAELCARYGARDLAIIHDFVTRAIQMAQEETHKLRQGAAAAKAGRRKPRRGRREPRPTPPR
jgi:DNA-binding MarR family transcriptional regulator